MKDNYSKLDLDKAFALYYNEQVSNMTKKLCKTIGNVITLEVGKIVEATVTKMDKNCKNRLTKSK